MAKFAENTKVPVEKTRAEIESTLRRFGADMFSFAQDDPRCVACIFFRCKGRMVRFTLQLPKNAQGKIDQSERGVKAARQKWRALFLSIKAKLSAIESGIAAFEEEFLAHVVLPGNQTASEWLRPQLAIAYETGKMPSDLLALPAPK